MKGGQGNRGLKDVVAGAKSWPELGILQDQMISTDHLTFSHFFPVLGAGMGEGVWEGGGEGEGVGAVEGERHGWWTAGDGGCQDFSMGGEEGLSFVGEEERHGV